MDATTIDRLLHDAEHADSGQCFAQTMMSMDGANYETHRKVRDELRAKRDRLLAEALALDPDRTDPAWEETTLEVGP